MYVDVSLNDCIIFFIIYTRSMRDVLLVLEEYFIRIFVLTVFQLLFFFFIFQFSFFILHLLPHILQSSDDVFMLIIIRMVISYQTTRKKRDKKKEEETEEGKRRSLLKKLSSHGRHAFYFQFFSWRNMVLYRQFKEFIHAWNVCLDNRHVL